MSQWIRYTFWLCLMVTSLAGRSQDTVLMRTLGTSEFEEGTDLIYLQDSGFLVLGNVSGVNYLGDADFLLARYDAALQELWSVVLGSGHVERTTCVTEVQKGLYLVGGMSYYHPPLYRAFVALIDSNGHYLGALPLGSTSRFSEVREIVLSNGNIYALFNEWSTSDPADRSVYAARIQWNAQWQLSANTSEVNGSQGLELASVKTSSEGGFLAVGSKHNATLDAFLLRWDDSFDETWSAIFSTAGGEKYHAVAEHPAFIATIGYTDGYNDPGDRDIVVHKYTKTGTRYWEDVRGYLMGGPNGDDEGLDIVSLDTNFFYLTGYSKTFGQGAGLTADIFLTKSDTGFIDALGSNTVGDEDEDVARKILPWRSGIVALGYTDSYGKGLTDILILERAKFGDSVIHVMDTSQLLAPDTAFLVLHTSQAPAQRPSVTVHAADQQLLVSWEARKARSISCYDLLGRNLFQQNDLSGSSLEIPMFGLASQAIIVRVEGDGWYESKLIYIR